MNELTVCFKPAADGAVVAVEINGQWLGNYASYTDAADAFGCWVNDETVAGVAADEDIVCTLTGRVNLLMDGDNTAVEVYRYPLMEVFRDCADPFELDDCALQAAGDVCDWVNFELDESFGVMDLWGYVPGVASGLDDDSLYMETLKRASKWQCALFLEDMFIMRSIASGFSRGAQKRISIKFRGEL